jgi:glucan phosphoethanolaminetransferase (alkaline phosphatase superfamily)
MEEPKSYELSYYFFSCLVAFALYEGMYFFSFPIVEFLEFLGAALCLAFTGGFLLLFSNRYIRGFGFIYFFITITLYIFYSGHHLIFGTPPTSNVYVSLFETNSSETLEFLESYTNIGLFLKLLLPALLSLPLYGILKISHKRIGRKYIFLSFLFTMGTIASVANLKYKSPYRFLNQYLIYQYIFRSGTGRSEDY